MLDLPNAHHDCLSALWLRLCTHLYLFASLASLPGYGIYPSLNSILNGVLSVAAGARAIHLCGYPSRPLTCLLVLSKDRQYLDPHLCTFLRKFNAVIPGSAYDRRFMSHRISPIAIWPPLTRGLSAVVLRAANQNNYDCRWQSYITRQADWGERKPKS